MFRVRGRGTLARPISSTVMPATRDGNAADAHALADLFRAQSALNAALGRWQAQWHRSPQSQPLTLQEAGLAVSFSRSTEGLYCATLLHEEGASLESGCCSTAVEAYLLVLGMVNLHTDWLLVR